MPYWEERQAERYLAGEKKVSAYYGELKKSFGQARREVHSVINNFYMRYADENGLTFTEAQKALGKAEIGELRDFIAKVNEHMGEYNQELNNMSIKARITRYQAMEKQIDAILQQLYSIDYELKGEETLKEVYAQSYYQTWFNIDQFRGFHQEFALVVPETVEELVKHPFNGANFSSRLWKQKNHMLQRLNESMTTMLVQGKAPKTLAEDFSKMFGTKEYEAYRLLQTESAFVMEQGALAAYKADGVEKYQFLATLDTKTSDICREADGGIYEVEKAITGVNYPPLHVFCRSTTVPYYDDVAIEGTRVARELKTGKTIKVPAEMTYKQWYNEYVAPQEIPKTRKIGNSALKEQLRYKHDGLWNFIPLNTIITDNTVIAGLGVKESIKDIDRLIAFYGGTSKEWIKCVGKIESDKYVFDIHWYQKADGTHYDEKIAKKVMKN